MHSKLGLSVALAAVVACAPEDLATNEAGSTVVDLSDGHVLSSHVETSAWQSPEPSLAPTPENRSASAPWIRKSIGQLRDLFDGWLNARPQELTGDPYNLSNNLAGLVGMYEATRDPIYVELALNSIENVFDELRDIDNDGFFEWSNPDWPSYIDENKDGVFRQSCLYTERAAKQFVRVARTIKQRPELNRLWSRQADSVIDTVKNHIINHPDCRDRWTPEFSTVHHIVSHTTCTLLELYRLEGDQRYLDYENHTYGETITSLARSMRETVYLQQAGSRPLVWARTNCTETEIENDSTYPDCYYVNDSRAKDDDDYKHCSCGPADVGHADEFVYCAAELYRAGFEFTKQDIHGLRSTFINKIWNRDLENPKWHDFVDGHLGPVDTVWGSVENNAFEQWRMGSRISTGWFSLGAFDDTIQRIVEASIESSETNTTDLKELSLYGSLARNIALRDCVYSDGKMTPVGADKCDEQYTANIAAAIHSVISVVGTF